ncbi:MAG: UDP-N-acetylmuramoyl-L-alanine--D-glutamate ligase [Actinomycetota bacterium]
MSGAFRGRRVVVVGGGVAGAGVARVLAAEGADVLVSEVRPADAVERAAEIVASGATLAAGGHEPAHLDGATLVVASPGVPQGAPILGWAAERGIPVWGELELGARVCDAPYVAVTGTNGKTTTTGMIASCLRAGGLDAVACGNIGHPFAVAAREGHGAVVVEASSFQLRFVETFRPRVSVLLNLAPDHLDWHGSERAYADAKANVFRAQGAGDTHVGNRDDPSSSLSVDAPCPVVWFRLDQPQAGEVGYLGDRLVARVREDAEDLGTVDGQRCGFRADAAAAAAASLAFGVSAEAVRNGLAAFVPPPHRGESVAMVDGVRFVDNSKATNVHAALAALDAVWDAVLIAGGRAKGVDLSPLRSRADRLAGVVAIGESASDIEAIFRDVVPVRVAGSIEEATRFAWELAPRPGTVLLAPACASWDMFRDYAERGDRFSVAAQGLIEGVGTRG